MMAKAQEGPVNGGRVLYPGWRFWEKGVRGKTKGVVIPFSRTRYDAADHPATSRFVVKLSTVQPSSSSLMVARHFGQRQRGPIWPSRRMPMCWLPHRLQRRGLSIVFCVMDERSYFSSKIIPSQLQGLVAGQLRYVVGGIRQRCV